MKIDSRLILIEIEPYTGFFVFVSIPAPVHDLAYGTEPIQTLVSP
ncbi:MAG TPA: hypothetical protein VF540_01690 [Segetibacter sp.]